MSGPFGSSQWMYQSAAGFYDYEIGQSLRFEDGDSAFLSRTPASAGNRKVFTISFWVKRANLTDGTLLAADDTVLYFNNDKLRFRFDDGAAELITNMLFRDVSAWYHIVYAVDTTQGTASNRAKLYVNGELITSFSTDERDRLANDNLDINSTPEHRIGRDTGSNGSDFDGYLAEYQIVDGQQLNATDFGETKSGIWIPKEYTGSYGTNGFHLDFADSSTLGNDVSGNNNDFTSSGLASTDQVPDSPTNSFATLNPLAKMGVSNNFNLFEGNLTATYTTNSNWQGIIGNIGVSSGKWYYEVRYDSTGEPTENRVVGWSMLQSGSAFPGGDTSVNYEPDTGIGFKGDSGVVTQGSATNKTNSGFTHSQIIGLAIDLDNRTVDIYKNNVDIGGATNIDEGTYWPCVANFKTSGVRVNFGQDSSFAGAVTAQNNSDANGIGDFYYTPPSGYLALCTANLPDPAIDPNEDETPEDYFNTVTYSGTNGILNVTGVGFQPDWVWIKKRNAAAVHVAQDAVRGSFRYLQTDSTAAENTSSANNWFRSFNSDGFTVSNTNTGGTVTSEWNTSGDSYVSWNWLAGNGTSSNTDGTITSTVSANTEAGFSIVGYTGTGTAGNTVGHGLSSTPDLIIVKRRDAVSNWLMYHSAITNAEDKYLTLETTNAVADNAGPWNDTAPTSSVFTVGSAAWTNTSGGNYISYCFHSVDGYSKVGGYEGNGSSDGAFIYTGFRPAFVLIKRTNGTTDWMIKDNRRPEYNTASKSLRPNQPDGEFDNSNHYIDLVSNGFKCRGADNMINASGSDYIYMAFAEQPFKYANAR